MSAFPRAKFRARLSTLAGPAVAVSLAALLAACSTTRQPAAPQVYSWQRAPEPQSHYAGAVPSEPVELEDDGLPSQAPPPVRIRHVPDDPNAPWSPNYGRSAGDRGWQDEPLQPAGVSPDDGGDGYPVPKSPEEAGLRLPAGDPQVRRGVSYMMPHANCTRTGTGWSCRR
jgi:hypothetical protein